MSLPATMKGRRDSGGKVMKVPPAPEADTAQNDATQYLTRFQLKKLTTGVTPRSSSVEKVKALQSKVDLYEIIVIQEEGVDSINVDSDPDVSPQKPPKVKKKYKRR